MFNKHKKESEELNSYSREYRMRFRYKVFIDNNEKSSGVTLNLNILAIYSEFSLLIEPR